MQVFMPAAIATGITFYLGLMGCIGGLVGRDGLIGFIGLIVGIVAISVSYALWTLDTLPLPYWASNMDFALVSFSASTVTLTLLPLGSFTVAEYVRLAMDNLH
jgi:hypothetical protein